MNKKFNQYISIFLNYLKSSGYAPTSIILYSDSLKFFKKFIIKKNIKHKDIFSLTSLFKYKKYFTQYRTKRGKKLKPNTTFKRLSCLATFFNYLADNNYIFTNPFDKIDFIKKPKTLPKNIPTEKEINTIMKQVKTKKLTGFRDLTILEVLFCTGIRKSELINLSIYDIELRTGFLRVFKGKGSKGRIVPLGKIACIYLEKYINEIRPLLLKGNNKEQALFINMYGRQIGEGSIDKLIQKYVKKAGLKNISCHSFRHACATSMLKGKASIKHVQEMLGHKLLSSTQIYTQVLPADLLEVHKENHPSWNLFNSEKK